MELAPTHVAQVLLPPPALRTITVKVFRELVDTPNKKVVLMVYPGVFDTLNPGSVFVSGDTETQTFTAEAADREWLFIATDQALPNLTGAIYATITEDQTVVINLERPFDPTTLQGDGYLAGSFPYGLTTEDGAPVPATVRVLLRGEPGRPEDGLVVTEVASDVAGTWLVENLNRALKYDLVARKADRKDVIASDVTPAPMHEVELLGDFGTESPSGTVLTGYLDIYGGYAPYTLSVSGPNPPANATFSVENGRVVVSDSGPYTGPYEFTLSVSADNDAEGSREFYYASDTPWTPANLVTAAQIWLDDLSLVTDVSGFASAWEDRSANALAFTQSSSGSRPEIISAGLNGHRVLRFDGVNDSLTVAGATAGGLMTSTHCAWAFTVSRKRAVSAISALFGAPRGGAGAGVRFAVYGTLAAGASRPGVGGRRLDADSFAGFTAAAAISNDWHMRLDIADWSARTATLWVDGALNGQGTGLWTGAGTTSPTLPGGPLSVGAVYSASGFTAEAFENSDVAVIVVGNGAPPTGDDVDRLFGWAAWRYGLEGVLPAGHPYKSAPPFA